ncbi:Response regulator PleD [bacterium HR15]|nr:Response regulator PleD [bacterium HR15]
MWDLVRGVGLAAISWLLWSRGWTPLGGWLLIAGALLLGALAMLERWTFREEGNLRGRLFLRIAGLIYDLALVSVLIALWHGGEQLPLPLLYLLPSAHVAWQLGSAGGTLSAILTPLAFWLMHWATTRSPLFDSPADWGWLGGLVASGFLLTWVAARPATEPGTAGNEMDTALQEKVVRVLEETEAAHRELRVSYRELAHHYQRLQDALTNAQDALELLTATRQASTPQQLYPLLLDRLRERFHAAGAALWLVDEQKLQIQIAQASGVLTGWNRTLSGSGARPAWQHKVALETVQYLKSLALDAGEAFAEAHQLGAKADPRVLTVPLRTGTRYYGVVVLTAPLGKGFEPGMEERVQALAPHLTAIVSLYEQLSLMEARLQETQLLHDLDKLLFTVATPAEIPPRALAIVQPVLRFESALLALRAGAAPLAQPLSAGVEREEMNERVQESDFQVVARWREMPDILSSLRFEKGIGLQGWRATRARPLLIRDARNDSHAAPELYQAGIGSLMLVGLSAGARLNGFLLMAHSQPDFFTPADLEAAQVVATHLTLLMERARLLHQLEQLAVTDGLTGLYNYRHFHERYQEEVRRARRYQTPFAVMLIDMDNFKQVNDQYGHLEGDYVLMQVADLIRRTVRETELVARYGGDEFVILFPATNLQGARIAAERLLQAMRTSRFATTEGEPIANLTLSIGLAAYPDSSSNPAEILEKADDALETAKKTGRNRLEAGVN